MRDEELKLLKDVVNVLDDNSLRLEASIAVLLTIVMQCLVDIKLTKTEIFTAINESYEAVKRAETQS